METVLLTGVATLGVVQVLEAQMLPATAPFYMGLAAGWAVFLSNYIQHTGARMTWSASAPVPSTVRCRQSLRGAWKR